MEDPSKELTEAANLLIEGEVKRMREEISHTREWLDTVDGDFRKNTKKILDNTSHALGAFSGLASRGVTIVKDSFGVMGSIPFKCDGRGTFESERLGYGSHRFSDVLKGHFENIHDNRTILPAGKYELVYILQKVEE